MPLQQPPPTHRASSEGRPDRNRICGEEGCVHLLKFLDDAARCSRGWLWTLTSRRTLSPAWRLWAPAAPLQLGVLGYFCNTLLRLFIARTVLYRAMYCATLISPILVITIRLRALWR